VNSPRTKTVSIYEHEVLLYRVPHGRLWLSNPSDIEKFQGRWCHDQTVLRNWIEACVRSGSELPDHDDNDPPYQPPERQLWASVIDRALSDCRGDIRPCYPWEKRYIQSRAQEWILSTCEDEGSLLWICRHLDIDPELVRIEASRSSPLTKRRTVYRKSTIPRKTASTFAPGLTISP
jgi:hypothetical protein